jgi:hypothetical protein
MPEIGFKMSLTDRYYYEESGSQEQYSHNPTNDLNVSRFLLNKPAWKKPDGALIKKKKTLIIYAPQAAQWDHYQTIIAAERLQALKKQGFTIYLHHNNKFNKLNLNALQTPKQLFEQKPIAEKTLRKQAVQQLNLSHEELFVLNDEELQLLMDGDEDDYAAYTANDEINLSGSNLNMNSLNKLLHSRASSITSLNLSGCLNLVQGTITDGMKLPHLRKLILESKMQDILIFDRCKERRTTRLNAESIDHLIASSEHLTHLNLSYCPSLNPNILQLIKNPEHLEEVHLAGCSFNKDSFTEFCTKAINIKILDLSDLQMEASLFKKLLKKNGNLKKLNLSECKHLSTLAFYNLDLPHLEELNLNHTDIDTWGLSHLLESGSKLKKLDLSHCKNLSNTIYGTFPLDSLEALDLSNSKIQLESLENLLKSTKNLKKLILQHQDLNDSFQKDISDILDLELLEEIDLTGTVISDVSLAKIIAKAKNLKKIHCGNRLSEETLSQLNYESLEEIKVNDNPQIINFLKNTQALKSLRLTYFKNFPATIPETLNLDSLTKLGLDGSTIGVNTLVQLLKKVKNLKILDLRSSKILLEENNEELNLNTLEELILNHSTINSSLVTKLLKNARRLKRLNIAFCENISEKINEELNLETLEDFFLFSSNISTSSVKKIIKNARNLNKLFILECPTLSEEVFEVLNPEPLQELDLRNSNISSTSLGTLLKNAKNLKKIDLSFCNNLHEELSEPFNLESLEKLDLRSSNLSSASLVKLLKNAKNLKKLTLSNCSNLFDLDLYLTEELVLPHLTSLNVSYTSFDRKVLQKIKSQSHLNIQGADLITAATAAPPNSTISRTKQATTKVSTTAPTSTKTHTHLTTKATKTPPTSNPTATKTKLDADTTPSAVNYALPRLFYGIGSHQDPEVSAYRQQVFNQLTLNPRPCGPLDAFELSHRSQDLQLEPCSVEACTEDTYSLYGAQLAASKSSDAYYYSKQSLKVGPQWQALTSLSAQEQMLHYHVNPASTIELRYSRRDNLYYVRSAKPQNITLDFIVKVPQQDTLTLQKELAPDIQRKIQECQNFANAALKALPGKNPTGADYLNALTTQKVGACRHRMAVLAAWMQQNHPDIPVRCVLNECHAFVEIQHNNEWIRCDLGGYPATLTADDSFRPAPLKAEAIPAKVQQNQRPSVSAQTPPAPVAQKKPEQVFFPQDQSKKVPANARSYLHELLSAKTKRQLIEVANASVLAALRFGIQDYCQNQAGVDAANPDPSRPCCYIDAPEDLELLCAGTYLQLEGTQGILKEESYGRLRQWLKESQGKKPLLLINYSAFKPSDIARFHLLLEDNGPLPQEVQLIGLMNQDSPDVYDGVDFYSRFDQKPTPCPLPAEAFPKPAPLPALKTTEKETYVLEFFGGSRWEEQVYGSWIVQGERLSFRKSELQEAFAAQKTIEWRNAPWHDEHFVRFWQEAQLYGCVHTPYEPIELPKEVSFIQSNGYDWAQLTQELSVHREQAPSDALVLNPSTLPYFFSRYECDASEHTLTLNAGILQTQAQKPLSVYLSAPLPSHVWARLLDSCRHHQIALHIHPALGVVLPPEFPNHDLRVQAKPAASKPWVPTADIAQDFAISSTDIDATLHDINADLVLDVSELDPSDLLRKIVPQANQNPLNFRFTQEEGALIHALAQGKKVLLKGHFSDTMNDALNQFLYTRQHAGTSGQVILISAKPELKFLPLFQHEVDANEKQRLIALQNPPQHVLHFFATHDCYKKQALAPLQAMVRQYQIHPDTPDLTQAWAGMKQLPASSPQVWNPADFTHTKEQAELVDKERLNAIETVLKHSPFVFIAGKTAVGKTTFLHQIWKKNHPHLHVGEQSLQQWATDTQKGLKVLFLDEANLTSRQWSEFESLFANPPGIMIGNHYYPLTPEHKVIFAGNPLSYGGERTLPALFARHGHSVVFQPLPPAYLYHKLIAPIFSAAKLDARALAVPILDIADFLTQNASQHVLISARELSMMALLTVAYCSRYPKAHPLDVVRYYAYHLSHSLVPKDLLSTFNTRWKEPPPLAQNQEKSLKNFQINASNQSAFRRLNELLELRALRQKQNDPSLDGGLGGIILEGEPGIGKSDLVAHCLAAHGLHKASLEQENNQTNSFYHIPVSMALAQKKELLLRAFHQGAVVLIDEINCAPLMEDLLNDLLIGKTPEGAPPKKPGFTLIGTQNPPHMAGRRRMTDALLRRLHTVVMPSYSAAEMSAILILQGLPQAKANAMVNEYLKRIQEPNHSSLCFRDLIKRAQQELLDLNAQTPTPESTPAVMPETTKASAESSIVTTHVSPTQESSKIQEKPNTQTFKAQTTPEISAETPFREHLKTQLKNYIHRIEVTQNSDFKYGFWFFKQSRATNRHANYKLAQNFLEHLNQEKSLLELFADIEQQRTDLIKINKLNQKDNHGIHSADLLNIIAAAKKFIHEEHPEEANCFCVRSK